MRSVVCKYISKSVKTLVSEYTLVTSSCSYHNIIKKMDNKIALCSQQFISNTHSNIQHTHRGRLSGGDSISSRDHQLDPKQGG